MFSTTRHILPLALMSALLIQCEKAPSGASTSPEGKVVAMVAGEPITDVELREEAEWRISQREKVLSASELLDEMIERRALLSKTRAEKLDQDPATRRRIESLLIARLRERDLASAVADAEISEEEIREAYQARSEDLSSKGMDRFAILFLEASGKSSETHRAEVKARLEEGIAKSDANPAPGGRGPAAIGFGAFAAEYSDDQAGRYRGGDVGWIRDGESSPRVPEPVLEQGRELAKGERSGVIETEAGFYVIMKTDSRPGGLLPLEELSPLLYRELLVAKRKSIEEQFISNLLDEADVSIDSEALRQVELPTSAQPSPSNELPGGPDTVPTPSASR